MLIDSLEARRLMSADVAIDFIDVSGTTYAINQQVTGEVFISNFGPDDSPANKMYLFLSTSPANPNDPLASLQDVTGVIGTADIPSLPAFTEGQRVTFSVPLNYAPADGIYYVFAFLSESTDDLGTFDDNVLDNFGTAPSPITVQGTAVFGGPDLTGIGDGLEGTIGGFNTAFGTDGVVTTSVPGEPITNFGTVGDKQDRQITVGVQSGNISLIRFNGTGGLDTTFGNGGQAIASFGTTIVGAGITVLKDGSYVVGGYTADYTTLVVAKFNTQGVRDPNYGYGDGRIDISGLTDLSGDNSNPTLNAVTSAPNGKIYICGSIGTDGLLIRLNADGTVDSSFQGGDVETDLGFSEVYNGMTVLPDGSVLVAANAVDDNDLSRAVAVHYLVNGKVDPKFGNSTFDKQGYYLAPKQSSNDFYAAVAVEPKTGLIYLAGAALTGEQSIDTIGASVLVTRLDKTGKLDKAYGSKGNVVVKRSTFLEVATGILLGSDGKIVLTLQTANSLADADNNSNIGSALIRLLPNGKVDKTFNKTGRFDVVAVDPSTAANDVGGSFDQYSKQRQGQAVYTKSGNIIALSSKPGNGSTTYTQSAIVADAVDLTATSSTKFKGKVVGGTPGTLTLKVSNQGTLTASGNITTTLLLDDMSITAPNFEGTPLPKPIKSKVTLKPGTSMTMQVNFTFPANLPSSVYTVRARVSGGTKIPDVNGANNLARTAGQIQLGKQSADLAIKLLSSIPAALMAGQKLNLTYSITNVGNSAAEGNLKFSLFASDAATYNGNPISSLLDKTVSVKLAKGASQKVTLTFTVPASLPTTPFFLGGVLTGKTKVADGDVTNNAAFSKQPVTLA